MAMAMAMFWPFRKSLLLLSSTFLVLLPWAFSASDSEALLKLKKSLTNAGALDSWVPGSPPCSGPRGPWRGLLCEGGVVKGLRLEGMGLSGTIDVDALVEMKALGSFSVENNSFTDTIPQLNRLGALKALSLSRNKFSGEIPSQYFVKMRSLRRVRLSHNKFTGEIPVSLARLPNLVGLHLQFNQFRGRIPSFYSQVLKSFNVSNNILEGEIPSSLSRFSASSFAANPFLCGEQIDVECPSTPNNTYKKTKAALMVALGAMLLLVIIFFAIRLRNKNQKVSYVLRRSGSSNAATELPVSVLPKTEDTVKSACSDLTVSNHRKPSVAELVMVNDEMGVFGLTDLMKASAEVLGNGPLGSSYKLGKLSHPNVLPPLAYHYRKEEKLVVYEYLRNGSLLYHWHGDAESCRLDWPTRVKIVRGIAKGLEYLHNEFASRDVPHGNLKSSNVLLGPDYNPLLSDYGFHPLLNVEGLEGLFAYKTPEAMQKQTVSPKSDVYCLGIIIIEMLTGERPSQSVHDGNGLTDIVQWVESAFTEGRQAELLDTKIQGFRNSIGSMEKLLRIGALCTKTSPEERLSIKEAVGMIEEIHEFRVL
ncbi:Jasmonate-zim-domain protein 6, putative isoform 1 [Hibiscus syriacus]|uniref:Jasmonate-zim-domain protein 6, putative isoform 1 n=1 Tax=Hibiscus syriacus TaxID=106335 RepID=A0A6A3A8G6_HIBSY|nr:Jasmonate-zim-domain protein 6, putative isoform 1 [Hibiscus syriacus]